MQKKSILWTCIAVVIVGALLCSCAGMQKASEQNFQAPVVKLSYVDVAHYWGWWYYSKKIKPTMGKAGDYGAPLDLAFIYEIENPNKYPVMLEELKFTIAFEEFDLNTVSSVDPQWIPPGRTNNLRVHAMFDGRTSLLSLLVAGGFKLKEKTGEAGAGPALKQLGAWWEAIPEFSFPVHVKEGSAVFTADGVTKVTTFNATFP